MAGVTTYTPEIGEAICERIAEGESLRKICADDGMPSRWSVFRWLEENEAFRNQYARAREWQADTLLDEALEIADDGSGDMEEVVTGRDEETGEERTRKVERFTSTARAKLKIDARLKLMGQLAPKKYGPKMSLSVKDENPTQSLTDEELLNEIRKLVPKE